MAGRASDGSGGRNDLLATLLLVVASMILMRLPEGAQHAVGHIVRSSALQPFLAVNGSVNRYKARATDYDRLRAQYDSLLTRVAARRTLAEENRQLRGLLILPQQRPAQFVPVTVVRPGTTAAGSVFYIDAGAAEGISRFDAVVTETGLLGQVQDVRAGSATAFDWSHPDFRASAMSADGAAHGLVEPSRGDHREQDLLLLRGTAYLSGLEAGDEILTSGRGGTLPRGVLIGWVIRVAETSAGWSRSYYVEPAVHPGAATHAAVEIGPLPMPAEVALDSAGVVGDSVAADSVAVPVDSVAADAAVVPADSVAADSMVVPADSVAPDTAAIPADSAAADTAAVPGDSVAAIPDSAAPATDTIARGPGAPARLR